MPGPKGTVKSPVQIAPSEGPGITDYARDFVMTQLARANRMTGNAARRAVNSAPPRPEPAWPGPDPRTAPRETPPVPQETIDQMEAELAAERAAATPSAPAVTGEMRGMVRSLPALMAFVEAHGFEALPPEDQDMYLRVMQALQQDPNSNP